MNLFINKWVENCHLWYFSSTFDYPIDSFLIFYILLKEQIHCRCNINANCLQLDIAKSDVIILQRFNCLKRKPTLVPFLFRVAIFVFTLKNIQTCKKFIFIFVNPCHISALLRKQVNIFKGINMSFACQHLLAFLTGQPMNYRPDRTSRFDRSDREFAKKSARSLSV